MLNQHATYGHVCHRNTKKKNKNRPWILGTNGKEPDHPQDKVIPGYQTDKSGHYQHGHEKPCNLTPHACRVRDNGFVQFERKRPCHHPRTEQERQNVEQHQRPTNVETQDHEITSFHPVRNRTNLITTRSRTAETTTMSGCMTLVGWQRA